MPNKQALNILMITASANAEQALTRRLARHIAGSLRERHPEGTLVERDLSHGIKLLDQAWLDANLKPPAERSAQDKAALAQSEELIAELQDADAVVIGTPLYNFSIPASLKAWIDQVARAGVTFRYSSDGPVGLLEDKPVYLAMASGGVPFGGPVDFASDYLRHVLGFIGLQQVSVITAEATNRDAQAAEDSARTQLQRILDDTRNDAA